MRVVKGFLRLAVFALAALLMVALTASGCGKSAAPERSEEERVAEEAVRVAMRGDAVAFLQLVAPSFLERARAEMPDAEPETLGAVLLAGFSEEVPYAGAGDLFFEVSEEGDRAVVHVWGEFLDAEGNAVSLGQGDALRVALRREEGRWYVDLLDL
ncbi:MAG: hypothetical protein H5T72_10625 [Actinobacteria bacterium]|nr:hypothetical protein [Actinomycetota bacterium]